MRHLTHLALSCLFGFLLATQSIATSVSDADLRNIWQRGDLAKMQQIAESGDVRAQHWMGLMLHNRGRYDAAINWYSRAVENGDAKSANRIAFFYEHGIGRPKDVREALAWHGKAAELGDFSSQVTYATALQDGTVLAREERQAFQWYARAAAQRDYPHRGYAYFPMAEMYEQGRGVGRDLSRAYGYAKAAELTVDDSDASTREQAKSLSVRVADRLRPSELDTGEQLFRTLASDALERHDRVTQIRSRWLWIAGALFLAILGSGILVRRMSQIRLQPQSIAWRALAVFVLVLAVTQMGEVLANIGFNFSTVRTIYWSFALLGLAGYAYGFRSLSEPFWRAYSLIFTTEVTIRFMAKVGWVPFARLFGFPDENRHGSLIILLALALIFATCLALLRYGGWLKVPARPSSPSEQRYKVDIAAFFKRNSTNKQRASRYPMLLCALASLAGAAVVMIILRAWLGEWEVGLASIGFAFALLAFALGGRSLAENLSLAGKDTLVRGTVIGAMIGTLVSGSVALAVAAAILGGVLFARLEGLVTALTVALIGMPIGAVYGAATGAALILLGRKMSHAKG